MKLLTKELEKKFKKFPLGSQDGKFGNAEVIAKFFNPAGVGTWYIIEGTKQENGDYEMFGYCHLGDDEMAEFGSIMLSELEEMKLPFGLSIERDVYLKENIDLMQALKRDGIEVPNYIEEQYENKTQDKKSIYEFESVIIVRPDVQEENVQSSIQNYKKYFEGITDKDVEVENLGKKKLAYKIKDFSEGNYIIFRYEMDKDRLVDVYKKFRADENIIKFITLRNEPVYEDISYTKNDDNNQIKLKRAEINSDEEGLKQRVQEKVVNEYNDFIEELKGERVEVVIERAYEKVCKQEMVYAFEKLNLDVDECKSLLKTKKILDGAYSEWLKSDANFNEMLKYSVERSVKNIASDYILKERERESNKRTKKEKER